MTTRVRLGWRLGREGREAVELPLAEVLRHSVVLGKSGGGKTYLVEAVVGQLLQETSDGVCVTVIDMKGETVDLLLALLQLMDPAVRPLPSQVCTLAPGLGYGLPLNPLTRVEGMDESTQAGVVVHLLDGLSDQSFGPRMTNIARWLVRAAMALDGSLLDVHRILTDDEFAGRVAAHMPDVEVRAYLQRTFPKERAESREALRARIENLLAIPAARAMLCAAGSVPPERLLESRLTLVNLALGRLGGTRVARFIGNWVVTLLTAAIFARKALGNKRHSYVVIDEWQELTKVAADDIEDVLARARSTGVSLTLINQYASQIRTASQALWDGVRTNAMLEVFFRPNEDDLHHVEAALPVTGRMVDPLRLDRLLPEHEERRLLVRFLKNLQPRQALVVNHSSELPAEVISTLTLPAARAIAAWHRLPAEEKDAWRRGGWGQRLEDLTPARVRLPEPGAAGQPAAAHASRERSPSDVPRATVTRFPKGRAGKLVLS